MSWYNRNMDKGGYSKIVSMLLTCLIILFVAGFFLFLSNKSTSVTNKKTTPSESVKTDTVEQFSNNDPIVAGWSTFRDSSSGITFKYPSYIQIDSDSKSSKVNVGPTARSYYSFTFNPNPNADFDTFSAFVEIDGAKNFVLNTGTRFVSHDVSTGKWYANADSKDKPTVASPTYKNMFKDGNQFSPNLYSKTTNGSSIYGVFRLGDESRGTDSYLVVVPERDIIVHVGIRYNGTALDGSTMAVQALKKTFDKDLPHILRSVTSL